MQLGLIDSVDVDVIVLGLVSILVSWVTLCVMCETLLSVVLRMFSRTRLVLFVWDKSSGKFVE